MTLATDEYLLKGSPILLLWTPKSLDNRSGILQVINIEMMSNYLLEPQLPWVERAVFNVNGESLEYGNPLIEPTVPSEDEVSYEQGSLRYPFTLTLYGPSPTRLALATLPHSSAGAAAESAYGLHRLAGDRKSYEPELANQLWHYGP